MHTTGTWTLSTAFDVNLALVAAARVEALRHGLARPVGEQRVMARVARLERQTGLPHHRACRSVAADILARAPGAAAAAAVASAAEMLLAGERRYLMQNPGFEGSGVVRRGGGAGRGKVWLEDLALDAEASLPAGVTLGQRKRFRVIEVDPDRQRVRVECIGDA